MFLNVEPMAVFQMVWPGSWPASGASFYGPSPYGQAVYRVPYSVCEYVGVPLVVSHCSNIIPAFTNASKSTEGETVSCQRLSMLTG